MNPCVISIRIWLTTQTNKLHEADIATARLDCLVLLEDETGRDRGWLLAHPEYKLQGSEIENLSTKVAQRASHVPLAYIRGHAEFYGREFSVNAHTLVPRPETETMLHLFKTLMPGVQPPASRYVVVDVGTGSGAIGITVKLEFPDIKVIATDIDKTCLRVARTNAKKLDADIKFMHGNLLMPFERQKSKIENLILFCNLPYVPDSFHINRAASHEPRHALFGGKDGLDLYRTLFSQTVTVGLHPRYILAEALPHQHKALASIAQTAGYSLTKTDDFIQLFTKS